uniref:Uncharacterized protein n=1 Tax=Aegilops tauschii TaxID=37682 RepID=M8AT73_AEGTA
MESTGMMKMATGEGFPPLAGAAREEKEEERGMAGCGEAKTSSVSMDEEACGIEKKFGGMAPKKPLISKGVTLQQQQPAGEELVGRRGASSD